MRNYNRNNKNKKENFYNSKTQKPDFFISLKKIIMQAYLHMFVKDFPVKQYIICLNVTNFKLVFINLGQANIYNNDELIVLIDCLQPFEKEELIDIYKNLSFFQNDKESFVLESIKLLEKEGLFDDYVNNLKIN